MEKITVRDLPPISEASAFQHRFCADVEAQIYGLIDYQDSGVRDAAGPEAEDVSEDSGVGDGVASESSTDESGCKPAAKRPRTAKGRGIFHRLSFSS